MNQDKIKGREKLSYALINFGNIPIMTLLNSYLLIFYTNVCGLDPAACATLFLIARIMDGVNDPFVGFIIDHLPNTRMGHFRPSLIVGTILVSINFLALWFGPMMAPSGKLAIAYVSYLLIGFLFPVMDISLNSLLPVMSADTDERNALSSIKGLIYALGAIVIGVAGPLILGDTSNKKGYVTLILISTAIVFFFSIIGTLGVKERVLPPKGGASYGIKDLFRFFSQKPVYGTFIAILLATIGSNITNAVNAYFCTYILGSLAVMSITSLVMCITLFPTTAMVGKIAGKYGKKKVYLAGLAIVALSGAIRIVSIRSIAVLMISTLICGIGMAFISTLNYSIQADNTDYIELHMDRQAQGAISSLSSFVSKCAAGIGGAIPGYLLAMAGFDNTLAEQNVGVNNVIIACVVVIPPAIYLLAAIFFGKVYPITPEKLKEQQELLAEKRAKEA